MGKAKLTVGIVIRDGGRVLLVEHGEAASALKGTYGLPAGKLDSNENFINACLREAKEETGLTIDENDLKRLDHVYYAEIARNDGTVKPFGMIVFATDKFNGELITTDETKPQWFDIQDIENLNLLPNVKEAIEEAFSI